MDVKEWLAVERTKMIIVAIALVVIGVLFIALQHACYEVFAYIFAAALMACGLFLIILYFIRFKTNAKKSQIFLGLVALCFGVLLMFFTGFLLIVFAIGLTLAGIYYIVNGLELKRAGDPDWWRELICGLVEFVLGILFIIFFACDISALWIILGIILIVDGLFIVSTMFWYKKAFQAIERFGRNR